MTSTALLADDANSPSTSTAPDPTRVRIAGRDVLRVAFGGARLTAGDGWGVPADPERSRHVLRAALEAGIDHVDTADALGPGVSESIIGDVVGDRSDVLVATKVGMLRPGPHKWDVLGHPNYLRQQVYASLTRLRRERIDLLYLHRIDPVYPLEDQLGALQDLRDAGLVGAIGVSEPTSDQLERVLELEPSLAVVQSLYNVAAPTGRAVARTLEERGIPFVAYWPLVGRGVDAARHAVLFDGLARIGATRGLTAPQVALAWIYTTAPNAAAVVGSRSATHIASNISAAGARLDSAALDEIDALSRTALAGVAFDPRYSKDEE